jgi:hypothetical protein
MGGLMTISGLICVWLCLMCGANYLIYRVAHKSGWEAGYMLGRKREKDLISLHIANAKIAGRLELMRELNESVAILFDDSENPVH